MIPIIYHPRYNISVFGLERLHRFDGCKYQRIHDSLLRRGLRKPHEFMRPRSVTAAELRAVHTPSYLRSLKRAPQLAEILEVPLVQRLPASLVDWRILRAKRRATGGTILACRKALEQGIAINLGGGFHHAAADWGGGFCVYADIPIAAAILHREGLISKVLVVDLDAHQGNGIASVFQAWPWAFIFDVFEEDIFPRYKEPEDYAVPIPAGTTGAEYLEIVQLALPSLFDRLRPDLLIYNAGSDPFVEDPLARLRLTANDLAERDLLVLTLARERKIPVAMTLSGGYSSESWRIHTDAIEGILTRFDKD